MYFFSNSTEEVHGYVKIAYVDGLRCLQPFVVTELFLNVGEFLAGYVVWPQCQEQASAFLFFSHFLPVPAVT